MALSTLSERVIRLKSRALNWQETQTDYIGQRLYPALLGLKTCAADVPWILRKSHLLASVIRESRLIVHEDELLAGYNFSGGDDQQWLEMTMSKPDALQREQLVKYLSKGLLSEEQIEVVFDILESIDCLLPQSGNIPEPEPLACISAHEGLYWCYGTPYNHTIIGYAQVLEKGFIGIAEEIQEKLDHLEVKRDHDQHARMVLESMLVVAEAAAEIGERYADHIVTLIRGCSNSERRDELKALEVMLRRVPAQPAQTFDDAVQSLWFAHIINTWEDGINANSIGRLDQILFPYYQRDIADGRLTRKRAFELLCCLWIKLYRDYDVQQVALGGINSQGQDASNELTFLMLDVTEALDFVRCLSVRLHRNSPHGLLRRSLELVGKGKGIPFFFNDDVLIPALADNGIALADARDYAAIGCVEITIPGKANPHAVSNRINLLKCLELALNNGRSMTTGILLGPETGEPVSMNRFEDVISAYEKQVEAAVHSMCRETMRLIAHHRLTAPMPYKSLLTEGCMVKGRDFNDSGALYDFHESMPMGIPNVADSLAAIEFKVYQKAELTLPELVEALRADFPLESLRLALLNQVPKFGNDDDIVDTLAARVFRHYCMLMREVSDLYGISFLAQPFTFLWLVEAGKLTAATPDGRHRGENLAYSVSPMQGRDFKGLSALVNSLAKLPQRLAAGSTSAIVETEPVLFSDGNIDHLVTLLSLAIKKGVGQLQFNVVNEETLRKAQAEPDKYRNLAVRVSGFSQKFCLLSREIQDHIIARTKHSTF